MPALKIPLSSSDTENTSTLNRQYEQRGQSQTSLRFPTERTWTYGLTSARALTSVRPRQAAVHPPWTSVDSSHGCHDDGSTARVARATKTVSHRAARSRQGSTRSHRTCSAFKSKIVTRARGKLITTPVNSRDTRDRVRSALLLLKWRGDQRRSTRGQKWNTISRTRELITSGGVYTTSFEWLYGKLTRDRWLF